MGGSTQQLVWLIPVALGLGVWRITESVTRQKISLMALVSVVGSLVGWYLAQALISEPDANRYTSSGKVFAACLIGAVVVAAIFDFVFAKMKSPNH